MSRKLIRLWPLSIPLLALAACVTHGDAFLRIDKKIGGFTKHYEESLFAITERSSYDVELLLTADDLRVGSNEFEFIVHDSRDNDVEGATITMTLESAGRTVDLGVTVADEGNGLYVAKDLIVASPGPVRLTVTVSRKGIEDKASFDFQEVRVAATKP